MPFAFSIQSVLNLEPGLWHGAMGHVADLKKKKRLLSIFTVHVILHLLVLSLWLSVVLVVTATHTHTHTEAMLMEDAEQMHASQETGPAAPRGVKFPSHDCCCFIISPSFSPLPKSSSDPISSPAFCLPTTSCHRGCEQVSPNRNFSIWTGGRGRDHLY